jgi:ribosomal protein S18 acetylase RimI-like enzyme
MRLKISQIEKKEFLELFTTTPAADRKWLISFYHKLEINHRFYAVEDVLIRKIIGLVYSVEIKDQLDFSIIIFPKCQRQGFGENLISHLLSNYENASFTVSKSNIRMLRLLAKVSSRISLSINEPDCKKSQFKYCKN